MKIYNQTVKDISNWIEQLDFNLSISQFYKA